VLDERGGSYKGRLWTDLDPISRQVVFDATPTHEREGPDGFLADFRGKLQADAYRGYDARYQSGRVVEIGCWAHARRGFVEAFMTDTTPARTIAFIQQLYDVERIAAEQPPDARQALRQEHSVPLLAHIDAERARLAPIVLPKSPVGDGPRYLTNQWAALQRFAEDGRLAIDNHRHLQMHDRSVTA
jgi:transposase